MRMTYIGAYNQIKENRVLQMNVGSQFSINSIMKIHTRHENNSSTIPLHNQKVTFFMFKAHGNVFFFYWALNNWSANGASERLFF